MSTTSIKAFESFSTKLRWCLIKPEYIFQPSRILWRFAPEKHSDGKKLVPLPWGLSLEVDLQDVISSGLIKTGFDDLPIAELMWRLLKPGDWALDVGANIGYYTSLMAARVGSTGRVQTFEPHPTLFEELRANANRWLCRKEIAIPELHQVALSDASGLGDLYIPEYFRKNRGVSSLRPSGSLDDKTSRLPVKLLTLDEALLLSPAQIQLAKVDVEGHEFAVFRGAEKVLTERRLKHIIFEDFGSCPTESMRLLENFGYQIWAISGGLWNISLTDPLSGGSPCPWRPPNYLASIESQEVINATKSQGWSVLSKS